jgi:hypothetical protein
MFFRDPVFTARSPSFFQTPSPVFNYHPQNPTGWRYRKGYIQLRTSSLDAIKAAICYTYVDFAAQFSCINVASTYV